jgi:hypothetical protein
LHGSVLALALVWLGLRHMNWSWRHLLSAVPSPKEATA